MIRVLVVDDSGVVRRSLQTLLDSEPGMQVVGTACDPFEARERIAELRPDVITLDMQMPRMDGLSFLRRLMAHHPLPVVVLSSLAAENSAAALLALELGAVEVVAKPPGTMDSGRFRRLLATAVRAAARARVDSLPTSTPRRVPAATGRAAPALIGLGASTGGILAIDAVLSRLPADAPPCVVVQHLPPQFTASFAARLSLHCRIVVREAREGDRLRPGLALIAPGGRHMRVEREGDGFSVRLSDAPRIHHQRPSVDVLFDSIADCAGPRAAAALLTGMGADGAAGLLRIRQNGGFTVAESEDTCVVYGMPRQAIDRGAACRVAPLPAIAGILLGEPAAEARSEGDPEATGASTAPADSRPLPSGRY